MSTTMKRVSVSIPNEIVIEIETIKKTKFYNKSYAELYRQIMKLGLEKMYQDENYNGKEEK